jgi:hypothetical protein
VTAKGKSRLKEVAIAALLSTDTIAKAATKTGISARTLKRWLADSEFQGEYKKVKRELVALATGRLQAAMGKGVATLVKASGSGKVAMATRVMAARSLTRLGLDSVALEDIEERIAKLEQQSNEIP